MARQELQATGDQKEQISALLFKFEALFDDKYGYFHKHRGILS
jgi:hypothetical protein